MFFLVLISDTIRIPPTDFNREIAAITYQIEEKYCNQVLPDIGLVIRLHDILDIGEGRVFPGDGASIVTVQFRLTVWKPHASEILVGRIKASHDQGIVVTMDFFDHILIPKHNIPTDCEYSEADKQWKWLYEQKHSLWLDIGGKIRFKVAAHQFNKPTNKRKTVQSEAQKDGTAVPEEKTTPLALIGTLISPEGTFQPGLGMTDWWDNQEQEDGAETPIMVEEEKN